MTVDAVSVYKYTVQYCGPIFNIVNKSHPEVGCGSCKENSKKNLFIGKVIYFWGIHYIRVEQKVSQHGHFMGIKRYRILCRLQIYKLQQ
jgi:predicted nucleic acid-binding Zn ribbon protein